MALRLAESGARVVGLYGDFSRAEFGSDSPSMVWVAQKPR